MIASEGTPNPFLAAVIMLASTNIPDNNFDLSAGFKVPKTEMVRSLFSIDFP